MSIKERKKKKKKICTLLQNLNNIVKNLTNIYYIYNKNIHK